MIMNSASLEKVIFLANGYFSREEYSEAESLYRTGIEKYPEEKILLRCLGFCLLQQKKFDTAEAVLGNYLLSNPPDAEAWSARACALSQNGTLIVESSRVVAFFKNSVVNQPNNARLYADFGRYLWLIQENQDSYAQLYQAVIRSKYEENYLDDFLKVVAYLKNEDEAIFSIEKRLENTASVEDKAELSYILAHLYKSMGNHQAALSHLSYCSMIYPAFYKFYNKYVQFSLDNLEIETGDTNP